MLKLFDKYPGHFTVLQHLHARRDQGQEIEVLVIQPEKARHKSVRKPGHSFVMDRINMSHGNHAG